MQIKDNIDKPTEPAKQKTLTGLIWSHLKSLKKDRKGRSNGADLSFDLGFNTCAAETSNFLLKLIKEIENSYIITAKPPAPTQEPKVELTEK